MSSEGESLTLKQAALEKQRSKMEYDASVKRAGFFMKSSLRNFLVACLIYPNIVILLKFTGIFDAVFDTFPNFIAREIFDIEKSNFILYINLVILTSSGLLLIFSTRMLNILTEGKE